MITEAIKALKEQTGSCQVVIVKYIEEKQMNLPQKFKKLFLVQLKKIVASEKTEFLKFFCL
ncbi:hypothetical protein T459_21442 [Capsicum annuum]|uniref:H15 domain-containing protein n=1 Tax=Capsicum annuum TaxID=4072 RepID=A0A2G2YX26_CAPAN|nr:hypothetical protein T459_21442 [Capsicum annuum]